MLSVRQVNPGSKIWLPNVWSILKPYCEPCAGALIFIRVVAGPAFGGEGSEVGWANITPDRTPGIFGYIPLLNSSQTLYLKKQTKPLFLLG